MEIKWNQTSDSTYVREYYACEMYRDFGILAQRTNLASINLGDVHEGIFKIYEPVDKKFIKDMLRKKTAAEICINAAGQGTEPHSLPMFPTE